MVTLNPIIGTLWDERKRGWDWIFERQVDSPMGQFQMSNWIYFLITFIQVIPVVGCCWYMLVVVEKPALHWLSGSEAALCPDLLEASLERFLVGRGA
jgi:hypothetical protein